LSVRLAPIGRLALPLALAACARAPRPATHAPRLDLRSSSARVTLIHDYATYPITATTLREIRTMLAQQGQAIAGRRFAGSTHWAIRWQYRYERRTLACTLDPRVELTITITMPEWLPDRETDEDTKTWWRRYHAALLEHELGHARLAIDGAERVARHLADTPARSSCDVVGREANERGSAGVAALRERQAAYDTETRHGADLIGRALATPPEP